MVLLKEKRALITGGTSGLGKQIALSFASHGASVAIFGTNIERAKKTKEMLEQEKKFSEQQMCFDLVDVSNKKQVKNGVDRLLEKWKGIDILVNCAGITRDKLLLRMTEEDWDLVIDTNLKSVYNVCHALVRPMMKMRQGKIINISSVIGLTGNPGQVNYSASKHGMVGFTRSLAKELAPRNVYVNCIAPGFFKTPMTEGSSLSEEQKEAFLKRIPMGRFGDPKELGNTALFLASHMSDYITGQVITIDGGMLA